jgi:hypothetical protein
MEMPCEAPYTLQCEVKQDCGKSEKFLGVYRNFKWGLEKKRFVHFEEHCFCALCSKEAVYIIALP